MFQLLPSRAVLLTIGPLSIHWYGVLYAIAFLLGIFLIKRLLQYRSLSLSEKSQESLFIHVILGVILGGRLGFVIFYGGSDYFLHPLKILEVWNGGMSSHGGFIGVFIALILFHKRFNVPFLALTDVLSVPVALGLSLGRLGNLINAELYGTATDVSWAMTFPGVEGARHPTQIYAMLKDLFLSGMCFVLLRKIPRLPDGYVTSFLLIFYAVLRFVVEFFRVQPIDSLSLVLGFELSQGQVLSIPVFLLGIMTLLISRQRSLKVPH